MVVVVSLVNEEHFVTSLRVNPDLWKQAKIVALQCDMTLQELIDKAVREWIATHSHK